MTGSHLCSDDEKVRRFPVFCSLLSASQAYHGCTCASVHLIFLFLFFKRKKRYLVISAPLLNSLYHSLSIYLPTKICLFVCLAFSTLCPFQLLIIMMKQIPVMQEALTEHLTQRSVTLRHSLLRSCAHRVLPSFFFRRRIQVGCQERAEGGDKGANCIFQKERSGG